MKTTKVSKPLGQHNGTKISKQGKALVAMGKVKRDLNAYFESPEFKEQVKHITAKFMGAVLEENRLRRYRSSKKAKALRKYERRRREYKSK
jgi:hypothetical protein